MAYFLIPDNSHTPHNVLTTCSINCFMVVISGMHCIRPLYAHSNPHSNIFSRSDFSRSYFSRSYFSRSDFSRSDFSRSHFSRSHFSRSDFSRSYFSRSWVWGLCFRGLTFRDTLIEPCYFLSYFFFMFCQHRECTC